MSKVSRSAWAFAGAGRMTRFLGQYLTEPKAQVLFARRAHA